MKRIHFRNLLRALAGLILVGCAGCAATPRSVRVFLNETGGPRYEAFCNEAKAHQASDDANDYGLWIDELHAVQRDANAGAGEFKPKLKEVPNE